MSWTALFETYTTHLTSPRTFLSKLNFIMCIYGWRLEFRDNFQRNYKITNKNLPSKFRL